MTCIQEDFLYEIRKKRKRNTRGRSRRGEIQRVVPDYRVGLNPEQIRIREENGMDQ